MVSSEKGVADSEATTWRGAGVAVDYDQAALNDNSGADALAFASALLGRGDIMDEEGSDPKEKILKAIDSPAEAITAVVVYANRPKKNQKPAWTRCYTTSPLTPCLRRRRR